MDWPGNSLNEKFRKCGEITTALKVDKKVYALNCGFCSKIFIKLHAFTVHIGENHEQELFGCCNEENCDDESCEEQPVRERKENVLREFTDEGEDITTVDVKFSEIMKDGDEAAIEFQDPLEQPLQQILSKILPINLDVKEEVEKMIHEGFYDDGGEEDMDAIKGVEDKFDSCDTTISFESDDKKERDDEIQANLKELTLATIENFKKHSVVWDPIDSNSRKQHIEAYTSIANSINKQMSMSLKWTNIRDQINKLRHNFYSEFQNKKLAKSRGEDYTPIWYYDKLSFLNKNKNIKPRNKKIMKMLTTAKLQHDELPLPNLTDAMNLELIEIYKSFPCLWDVQHIGFRFKNQRQEAINEMIQDIKGKMKLNLTQEELQKKLYRIRHAYSQEKQRKQQCERLKKIFTPLCKFYNQISFLENNVRPFKCDFCEETFNGPDQYKIHKSKHDGSMPFTCPLCNRGFKKVGNCTVHLRRHTRDYPFECKVCKKRYATSTDVNVHMRHHTGEKPYFCEICGQSFRTWTFFDTHMRRHQKRPTHKCTICSKAFYENSKLTVHMKAHLNVRDKVCNVCGKAFTSSKYLRQHKQIHAEKRYDCKICGKDFAQYTGLSGHMRSHGTTVSGAAAAVINAKSNE